MYVTRHRRGFESRSQLDLPRNHRLPAIYRLVEQETAESAAETWRAIHGWRWLRPH